MNDLISRAAAKEAIHNTIASASTVVRVWNALDKIPAVDAAPAVHGQWTPSNEYKDFVECSECHDAFVYTEWITSGKWSFCPNCGAKMEEDIQHETIIGHWLDDSDELPPIGGFHD